MARTTDPDSVPHYAGHRQRLRRRFHESRGVGMPEYELLELLLTYGLPRRDVKPIAKNLLARFKTLAGVLAASHDDLAAVDGVGEQAAGLVALVRELAGRFHAEGLARRDLLDCPRAVADYARIRLAGRREEAMLTIYVDIKNHRLADELVAEGTDDQAVVYPRNLLRSALRHHATGILLAHNHPSGDCTPSADDLRLTRSLKAAAAQMDIRLLDHIVIGQERHLSFQEEGLL